MSEDQFNRLFRYMQEEFGTIRAELATKASAQQVDQLINAVDGIAARLDTDDQERAAMSAQLERHEGWLHQLADATNTKFAAE